MIKQTVVCGFGAALALSLLVPTDVSARGFPHPGLHRAHHHHMVSRYGYGGPVATYTPTDYAAPVIVVPAVYPASAPRCVHSRETVTVPAEGGGERQVTITRC